MPKRMPGRKPRKSPNSREIQDKMYRQSERLVRPALRWLARHGISQGNADEILEDARVKYAQSVDPKRNIHERLGYFFRILNNLTVDLHRKRARRKIAGSGVLEKLEGHFKKLGPESYSDANVREWLEMVEKVIGKQRQHRMVLDYGFRDFQMRHIDGLSEKEIAAIENVFPATIRWRIYTFKHFLITSGLAKELIG